MSTEAQIQPILDRIRNEGIQKAQEEARQILDRAGKEAESLLETARKKAQEAREENRLTMEKDRQAFETAMRLAARDLMLAVREELRRLCEHLVQRRTRAALDPAALKDMLVRLTESWANNPEQGSIEILLNEQDLRELENRVFEDLREALGKGLTLKPVQGLEAGFRVRLEGEDLYYDLSDAALAEMLGTYLNPRIAKFLNEVSNHPADTP